MNKSQAEQGRRERGTRHHPTGGSRVADGSETSERRPSATNHSNCDSAPCAVGRQLRTNRKTRWHRSAAPSFEMISDHPSQDPRLAAVELFTCNLRSVFTPRPEVMQLLLKPKPKADPTFRGTQASATAFWRTVCHRDRWRHA